MLIIDTMRGLNGEQSRLNQLPSLPVWLYSCLSMSAPRSPWRQPGVIVGIAIAVLINLVVDWLVFKPTNLVLFIVVEAVVVGGIVLVIACRSPRP
jgi:hypothetical protein